MERATDREFCEVCTAIISSTGVDKHGDRIHPDALRSIKNQIENEPEKRFMYLYHNKDTPTGEIIDVWIEEDDDDTHYLHAEIGIYEGHENVVEKVESGELSGMSIGFYVYENCNEDYWESRAPNLKITVDGNDRRSLNGVLNESGEAYRIEVQKSGDAAAIFDFAIQNWGTIQKLVILVVIWAINREGDGFEFSPTINLVNPEVTIDVDSLVKTVVTELDSEKVDDENIEDVKEIVNEEIKDFDESR